MSSEPQAERESLHDQRRLNHQFIADIGRHYPGYTAELVADLQVVGTRSIVDIADAVDAYPDGYGELLRLLRTRAVDAVVCRSRDRLGRVDSLIVTIERRCWHYVVVVIPRQSLPPTLDVGQIKDSEGAGLVTAIEAHLARSVVRRINNENAMGMAARIKRGKFANNVPWGYKRVYSEDGASRIEVDPPAAALLRCILLDLYLARGMGAQTIARLLNAEGHLSPKGRRWRPSAVRDLLEGADRFAGVVFVNRHSRTGREYVEGRGAHAPILSAAELAQVQAEFDRRRRGPRRPDHALLKGVILCSETGSPLRYMLQRGYVTYDCYGCRLAGRTHSISEIKVLRAVRHVILRLEEMVDPLTVLHDRRRPERERLAGEIDEMRRSLLGAEARRRRLLHVYVYKDSMGEGDFDTEMNRISGEIDALLRGIGERERALRELSDEAAADERLAAVRAAGRRILDEAEAEPERAREFLLRSFRVYVSDNGREGRKRRGRIDRIEIL